MKPGSIFSRDGARRRVLDEVRGFATLVGHGTRVVGEIRGQDDCIVNGEVEGQCELEGVLVLGEDARWQGDIVARNAVISGEVAGNIRVTQKLELASTARVTGSISSPAVAIAEGAIHQGEIHMVSAADIVRFTEKRRPGQGDAPP